MKIFIISIVLFSIFSSAIGTVDLLTGNADSIRLPSVIPGDSPSLAEASRPESFFGKLAAPLSFFQGGFPCLGASSLKAGKCMAFDTCVADGGFGDGKGLCLGEVVCCVKPIVCGDVSLLNNTILANPGFPQATNERGLCSVKLVKPFGITYVKLVIEDLELAQPDPHSGKCDVDALLVDGGVAAGFKFGKICGINAKTHLYIPTIVDVADIFIKIDLADDASIKRRWLLRAEFIEAKSPNAPPKGCVQYFREESGVLTSLNFDLARKTGLGNIDGLRYAICIDSGSESCSVRFDNLFFDLGNVSSHALTLNSRALDIVFRSLHEEDMQARAARPQTYYRPNVPIAHKKPVSPYYRPQPVYPTTKVYRPSYHRPTFFTNQRYPVSEFFYKVPSNVINPYLNLPLSVLHRPFVYPGQYKAPMKKPEVDADKLDKFDKLEDKLEDKLAKIKLEELNKLEGLIKPELLPRICPDQDVIIFPTPEDGTSAIHCGNDLHFGQSLMSSNPPFVIKVINKGKIHGKGFAVHYKVLC